MRTLYDRGGMRRLALVGSVALGCSAVNPLFEAADGSAGEEGGATSVGDSAGDDPPLGSATEPDGTTGEIGESSEAGDGTSTGQPPGGEVGRCTDFLWVTAQAKFLFVLRTDDWAVGEIDLPAEFLGGASAVASVPATGRVIVFGGEAEGLGLRDPSDASLRFAALDSGAPITRATNGPYGEDVYVMEEGGEDLLKLVGDEAGFTPEFYRRVGAVDGDGDLAPVAEADALLLIAGPSSAFLVPLDPGLEVLAQNLTSTMAATLDVSGMAVSVSGQYWASTPTLMWHVNYDAPVLDAQLDMSYLHGGAGLTDLAAVYLPPQECEELHAFVEAR